MYTKLNNKLVYERFRMCLSDNSINLPITTKDKITVLAIYVILTGNNPEIIRM